MRFLRELKPPCKVMLGRRANLNSLYLFFSLSELKQSFKAKTNIQNTHFLVLNFGGICNWREICSGWL